MIEYGEEVFTNKGFRPTPWVQSSDIVVQDNVVGTLSVWYAEERPKEASSRFLKEEERLIGTIAERLGHSILFHRMYETRQHWESASIELEAEKEDRWRGPIELLRRSDRELYLRIARKMVNHLVWAGVEGGKELLQEIYGSSDEEKTSARIRTTRRARAPVNEQVLLDAKTVCPGQKLPWNRCHSRPDPRLGDGG